MVLIPNFENQSHFFTPAALAANEQPPSSIADQRFIFQTNGVAIVNMPGQSTVDWSRDQALISPNMGDAFKAITTRHNIPIPTRDLPVVSGGQCYFLRDAEFDLRPASGDRCGFRG